MIELHGRGMSNREIAKAIEMPHWKIGRELNTRGIKPNGTTRGVRLTDGSLSLCSRCGEWKSTSTFPVNRRGKADEYTFTYCAECKKIGSYAALNRSTEAFIKDRTRRIVVRSRKLGVPCDLTWEYMLQLFEWQQRRCFYSGMPIRCESGAGKNPYAFSVDRVACKGGYLMGNVVIVADRVNTIKSDMSLDEMAEWTPGWAARASTYLTKPFQFPADSKKETP